MKTNLLTISLIAAVTLISGCAGNYKETRTSSESQQVNTQHAREIYREGNKSYYVVEDENKFSEKGQASWYGHPFHGRSTATGEVFNMYKMTAAHNSVKLPSYMRVTNLENDKSIIVRVNDHMPHHKTRVIDLSYAAAKELDMHHAGLARVHIETVKLKEVD